jgi:hypothetical protein
MGFNLLKNTYEVSHISMILVLYDGNMMMVMMMTTTAAAAVMATTMVVVE